MADRDLPFRASSTKPPAGPHPPHPSLVREVLNDSHMLVRTMILTLFFGCTIGSLIALATGALWGFLLLFPASITLLVWAAKRAHRETRQVTDGARAARQRQTPE